ncbi:MAG: hypothetical protein NC397_02570 [Clostridium sp.]|nr:hypothetical protein [Clostridium sp.]
MTDCSFVNQELKRLFDFEDTELEKYNDLIVNAVNCVNTLLKENADENDTRIVHLCAMKAYSQIEVLHNDDVASFSAGDVSFTRDTSSKGIELLLQEALNACSDLVSVSGFAFKAV